MLRSWVLVPVASLALLACNSDDDESFAKRVDATGQPADGGTGLWDLLEWDGPACAVAVADVAATPVDIILTMDQSPSMAQEIPAVLTNINTKLASILQANNVDYRVIFVGGHFCITPPLTAGATDPACYASNPPRYFHSEVGINNSDALTQLLFTYDGFVRTPNSCNKTANAAIKWSTQLRMDAKKVFIVVTDDDPSSYSYAKLGCTSKDYCANFNCPTFADKAADWGGADFPTELYKLQPAGMFGTASSPKWTFFSIIGVDKQYSSGDPVTPFTQVCNVNGNTSENSGPEYQKLSKLTGGIRFSSCDIDYSPVFQQITSTITPLRCQFTLASTNLGTIDPAKTNVVLDSSGGTSTVLQDNTKPCDAGANGWQFADGGNKIVLCGTACDQAKTNAQVRIVVGCATEAVAVN